MVKECSIARCDRPVRRREWCNAHYQRWLKYGDPLAGRTGFGEPRRWLREVALNHNSDDCLIWPFSRNGAGYGEMHVKGNKRIGVHRWVCERVNGPPPTSEHHAAHSCGRGAEGCVNPRHLRWATRSENMTDKLAHGTMTGGAKLTEAQVIKIRALKGKARTKDIAVRYGVAKATIYAIHNGKAWVRLGSEKEAR